MHVNKLRTSAPGFSFKRKGMNSWTASPASDFLLLPLEKKNETQENFFFPFGFLFRLSFLSFSPGQVPDLRRGAGIWCRVNCKKQANKKKRKKKQQQTNVNVITFMTARKRRRLLTLFIVYISTTKFWYFLGGIFLFFLFFKNLACTISIPYFLYRPESSSFGARIFIYLFFYIAFDVLDIFRVKTGICRLGYIRVILFRLTIKANKSGTLNLTVYLRWQTEKNNNFRHPEVFLFFLFFLSHLLCGSVLI